NPHHMAAIAQVFLSEFQNHFKTQSREYGEREGSKQKVFGRVPPKGESGDMIVQPPIERIEFTKSQEDARPGERKKNCPQLPSLGKEGCGCEQCCPASHEAGNQVHLPRAVESFSPVGGTIHREYIAEE